MSARHDVVLLTQDVGTRNAVVAAINGNGAVAVGAPCADMGELAARLRQSAAPAALVDVDPNPERILAELETMVGQFAGTRFIVLSRTADAQVLLDAMRVGARHVVAKSVIENELAPALYRLLPNGTAKRGKLGAMVTIVSASGGSGSTMLAVNLANELRLLSGRPTMLIDLDCAYGAVARYLGIEGQYSVADVLANASRLDGDLVKAAAVGRGDALQVLLSPASTNLLNGTGLPFEHLPQLVGACKETFEYTVLDAPRLPMDVTMRLALASGLTLVPFQLTVVGIRAAKALVAALVRNGCSAESIVPVANRYRKRRTMIGLEEAKKAMSLEVLGYIRNDFRAAVASVNYGRPLVETAKRSPLRKDVLRLAEHIRREHEAGRPLGTPW